MCFVLFCWWIPVLGLSVGVGWWCRFGSLVFGVESGIVVDELKGHLCAKKFFGGRVLVSFIGLGTVG